MKILLTLKHWQLFTILFGLPFIMVLTTGGITIATQTPAILIYTFIVMIIYILMFLSWFYILGTNLHKRLPATVKMKVTTFKTFVFIPFIYICLLLPILITILVSVSNHSSFSPYIFLLIIPLHLFSMFCIFYCLYFISKALKSTEMQRLAMSEDYIAEFFLFWFFPIGIWILQPRINKLFAPKHESLNE